MLSHTTETGQFSLTFRQSCTIRRRQWHPTPVLLPRKSHGRRSLVGCSPWGRQSRTRLSNFPFTFHFPALEKEMATHSSVLDWRIPGTGGLVGCCPWGRTESDTTEVTQQQVQLVVLLLQEQLVIFATIHKSIKKKISISHKLTT